MLLKFNGRHSLDTVVWPVEVITIFNKLSVFFELCKRVYFQVVEHVVFEDVVKGFGEGVFIAGLCHAGFDVFIAQGFDELGLDVLFAAVGVEEEVLESTDFSFFECLFQDLFGG